MLDYNTTQSTIGARGAAIDEGLRTHMNKVYGLMSAGLAVTGIVAYLIGSNPELIATIFGTPLKWVAMFAPLAVVLVFSATIHKMSEGTARAVFYGYAALMGLSISFIFAVYTGVSVAQTFFVTAIAFSSLSIYGYTTKRSLSAMGGFLMMGVVGLIVASIVNIFLQSGGLSFAISVLGVLIFAGLTAYDTQKIKNEYLEMAHSGSDFMGKAAILGALSLYLDFLNMFMFLLRLMGNRN
jgi:FtsH-binding integral membrane protein